LLLPLAINSAKSSALSKQRDKAIFYSYVSFALDLSTGQKFNGVEESLGIEMKVKDEVTQEIKATTKNAFR